MTKIAQPDSWLERACQLPVGFAQVREDPLVDVMAINDMKRTQLNVLMIASGGCTSALLATHPAVSELAVVDPNLSQLALTQLKLHLLQHNTLAERLAFLGHSPMFSEERNKWIQHHLNVLGYPSDTLGDLVTVSDLGLDFIGRYECLFTQLQLEISPFKTELEAIIANSSDPISCSANLIDCLNTAFRDVMALDNLVALYGQGATQNPAMPFWEHFFLQTLQALKSPLAKNNPFLSQMLLGKFCHEPYQWLTKPQQSINKKLVFLNNTLSEALEKSNQSFDFIHLSNALDWLNPQEARSLLNLVHRKLSPEGVIIIRQLNSTLEIPSLLTHAFQWQVTEETNYFSLDRSFFYKRLLTGKKS